jgi:hypothetical protein
MVMHSGTLEIHGDVGKVTGYSAKGGTFNILGNVVDRGWVCAVSDPRGPGLEVNIVGTAYEHLCQAFMGGSVIMLGLYWGNDGILIPTEAQLDGEGHATQGFYDALDHPDGVIRVTQEFTAAVEPGDLINRAAHVDIDDVRAVMARYGLPGMRVLLFAWGEDNPRHPYLPHGFPAQTVVYTGTHDNNTARGWWEKEASALEKNGPAATWAGT